jgi:hypothetical protein
VSEGRGNGPGFVPAAWKRMHRLSRRAQLSGGVKVMTSKPKYAGLGIALGAALGALAGILAGNVGIWLAIGIAVGVAIGATFRRREPECPQCAAMHRVHALKR